MNSQPMKVVRLDLPLDGASFDAIMTAEPTLSLRIEPAFGNDAAAWQALSTANVYHVSSARDDMPPPWFVAAPLLARCPDLLATDPFVTSEEIARRDAEPVSLQALLQRADVVSLHCPLDAGTRSLMGAPEFASMKPGTLFVTTARGGIHDEAALLNALKSGHLGGAGLDVWAVEPPASNHPLLNLDNVLATQHTAGVTHDSRRQMATMAASQIIALAGGAVPPRLVNPEVWPVYARRFEQALGKAVTVATVKAPSGRNAR
jgi:D-isomer specific 2-hydroxyacid dehydrogenase, NAD binding domain